MKVTTKNAIYLQTKDLIFMKNDLNVLPDYFIEKYFSPQNISTIKRKRKYDFIKIQDPREIRFIKRQDYLLDYVNFAEMSIDMIRAYAADYSRETQQYLESLELEDLDEVDSQISIVTNKIREFTLEDLDGILAIRMGNIDIDIPSQKALGRTIQKVRRLVNNIKKSI